MEGRQQTNTDGGFVSTSRYRLIYVFAIDDDAHQGMLKIGDTSIDTDRTIDQLPPNCAPLNDAAHARIRQYTNTAGISYELLHTELAVATRRLQDGTTVLKAFRDLDVHAVLEHSGHHHKAVNGTTGREWYSLDLGCAKDAIAAVKAGRANLAGTAAKAEDRTPIVFRQEQKNAINETLKRFRKADRYLWNAKMRFGKTLSALEVIRRAGFARTIIMTHRPVVDKGWYEDFTKIFGPDDDYLYGSHATGYDLGTLLDSGEKFVYFASIQDLRGSKRVGGKYDKNDDVFDTVWDLVIVDEAHEGTTTALGDDVISQVFKEHLHRTKFLALSGTAFNIISEYGDEDVYTWDYVMEQEMKSEWDERHFGDHNPYDDLPELRIYTYDLADILHNERYIAIDDKAFNFREFFRTWTGEAARDHDPMPVTAKVGDFVHEQDVVSFLNLMTTPSSDSAYPFSTPQYRDLFHHTFWLVPGVKEALALQRLMEQHPVFGNGAFDIINVAGDGDPDDPSGEALQTVQDRIAAAGSDGYTITLSCGKLTTGVTVPEWTGCFMLAGAYSTSASSYLQTIFRVQSPYRDEDGKVKETCYVFDFAPDRTLKMVTRAVSVSAKAGRTGESDKTILGKFLNYCPVIAVSGSRMKQYSTSRLLQQLKRAYAERAVRNGFDDPCLYNNELLRLNDVDIKEFNELKAVVGENKEQKQINNIQINAQGLTEEEYEQQEKLSRKPKRNLSPEEKAVLDKLNKAKTQRRNAIKILSQISVRIPLLIYGADVPYDDDISLDRFVQLVDNTSWAEFMPKGVTKRVFRRFEKYYDQEVFVAAGRHIRNQAKYADTLPPTERVQRIAALFSMFKNPDKETVLTPWRVVNMHMSDCLGGWCFFDEDFAYPLEKGPRFVDRGEITHRIFDTVSSRVLEINSKTGLYPLYMAYSLFRQRLDGELTDVPLDEQRYTWNRVVASNVFVICKTPMAEAITRRTLLGYTGAEANIRHADQLEGVLETETERFINRISRSAYWKKTGKNMKWTTCVGNPPYQKTDGGHGASASPVYQDFVETAIALKPEYVSMITPSRWFSGGKGLDGYRARMLHDHHMKLLVDFPKLYEPFPAVKIRGGISYFLWDRDHDGPCAVQTMEDGKPVGKPVERYLDAYDVLIRRNEAVPILDKVMRHNEITLDKRVSARKPFGLPTNFHGSDTDDGMFEPVRLYASQSVEWVTRAEITTNADWIDDWKVLVTRVQGTSGSVETKFLSNPIVAGPGSACTETYLVAGRFDNEREANGYASYLRTRFARFLISLRKVTQDSSRNVYAFVPDLDDYGHEWTDAMLYERYELNDRDIAYIESTVKPFED
ncbi:Eco57I restriction-modification methylase domain-containing protein [Bifidobacterium parmae]|uniref:DEAD/DEAH box helicase n=1 Tax=Bifidobacterium parmae TaxID=361854 RepID=A0A2N5J4Q0_9BIFI|nr:Eco57I restriction-modification methylase domain-containing protein [Bifidobacterium parmae]PLS29157.1 DEAD/DEAH box helicase [Bifidobacterium parmae]